MNVKKLLQERFVCLVFIGFSLIYFCLKSYSAPRASLSCSDVVTRTSIQATPAIDEWIPQLDSLQGRIQLLMSILQRHPNFVTANLDFRRNVLEFLSHMPDVLKKLGNFAQNIGITPPQVLSGSYRSRGLMYSNLALDNFRDARIRDLNSLELTVQELPQVLRFLKNKDEIKALLRIIPFLFSADGKPKFSRWDEEEKDHLRNVIRNSGPPEWENGYLDILPAHLDGIILDVANEDGMSALKSAHLNFMNQFVARTVTGIVQPTVPGLTVNEISLEEIPAVIPLGVYGGDCSMLSVHTIDCLMG